MKREQEWYENILQEAHTFAKGKGDHPPQSLYIGAAINPLRKKILLVWLDEDKERCRIETEKRHPDLSTTVLDANQSTEVFLSHFFGWLDKSGVPKRFHKNLLRLLRDHFKDVREQ